MKVTAAQVRDAVLLSIGSASLVNQCFIVQTPSWVVIGANLLMILGSTAINAYWLRLQVPTPQQPPAVSPPPSVSPSSSSGSSSSS